MSEIIIREAGESDVDKVLSVQRQAFGGEDEARLVQDLLKDKSAQPIVSLLAIEDNKDVGHILFTRARIDSQSTLKVTILAPLAVIPACQNKGIGGRLIKQGLQVLSELNTDLVFVLGYPDYYSQHGFQPAGRLGFNAPFPIPDKNADAWMVQALRPDVIGVFKREVICADKMNRLEYWQE